MGSSWEASLSSRSTRRPTWTLPTPTKPSAGSARSTATPCGSRMPALGRIRTRALTRYASGTRSRGATGIVARLGRAVGGCTGAIEPRLERLAGDALIGLHVASAGAGDDILGDGGRGWLLVPATGGCPVAHVLLVEARLPTSNLVLGGGAVARGVGGEDLVAEYQRRPGAGADGVVETQLELGVGEDYAIGAGVLGSEGVQLEGGVPDALHQRAVADQRDGALEVDRLVVADVGLGAGGEDRLRQEL